MGRRASGGSAIDLVFIAIAAVVLAIIFIVPYALAALLYTFPLLIIWLLLPVQVGVEPRLVIDASRHPQLAELRAQKRHADDQYAHIRYADWGVRWSDNLERFEERSIRGQKLNDELEHWKAESRRIDAEVSDLDWPHTSAFLGWSKELRAWHQQHALNAAKLAGWKQALLVFVAVWIAAELVGLAYPNFIRVFAFAWNPAPNLFHPGIALGATAGWATGIYRIYHPPKLFDDRASAQINEYLNARRIRKEAEDRQTTYSSRKDSKKEKRDDRKEDRQEKAEKPDSAWYTVLNVDPQSTIDDIKAAYKRAAMACHPDKVAHMNAHIQQVAKEEMQKLNRAFQQAQTARGF